MTFGAALLATTITARAIRNAPAVALGPKPQRRLWDQHGKDATLSAAKTTAATKMTTHAP
jgi:hypothetical protein